MFLYTAVHRFYSEEQFWVIQWKVHGATFVVLPNNVINSVQKNTLEYNSIIIKIHKLQNEVQSSYFETIYWLLAEA